ncbi:MAG: type II secretion system minor pseudopilin GspK [Thiogranum sp.]|nr:type II secretion system minor pseudopilin GspK [Thiogranum sp.]
MRRKAEHARHADIAGAGMTRDRQRGVALITALLVVSLATVAATGMATRQQLDIRRTANLLHSEQAWAYVTGAESWARVVLARDLVDSKIDTLAEDWSTQPPASLVEGGAVIGRILDMQARFNLNSLVVGGTPNAPAIAQYKRLLSLLDLEEALADYLVDWMDADINARFPDGAEDEAYLLLNPPYRAANQPLADISELRLVKGYDAQVIARLMGEGKVDPLVTALPDATAINVNTAGPVVLASLAQGLTLQDGEKLVEARGDKGFENVNEFLKEPLLSGSNQPDAALVSVSSQWFQVVSQADIGQGRARLASLIQRSAQDMRVVNRKREFADRVIAPAPQAKAP